MSPRVILVLLKAGEIDLIGAIFERSEEEVHFGYNVRESQLAISSRAALNTELDLVISSIFIQLLSKKTLKIKVK